MGQNITAFIFSNDYQLLQVIILTHKKSSSNIIKIYSKHHVIGLKFEYLYNRFNDYGNLTWLIVNNWILILRNL